MKKVLLTNVLQIKEALCNNVAVYYDNGDLHRAEKLTSKEKGLWCTDGLCCHVETRCKEGKIYAII